MARLLSNMPALLRELRFAARRLRRTPGFTLTAVLTLGTAIGASTAIYSIVYGLVLRPLPYPHPERIVALDQVDAAGTHGQNFSDPNFEDVRDQTKSFSALAEWTRRETSVLVGDMPLRAQVARVSRAFFDVMQTEPAMGRRFSVDESHEGGPPAVIVSAPFWREHFGAGAALGTARLTIDGGSYPVVGVMPSDFAFPLDTDLWVSKDRQGRNPFRTGHNFRVVARLRAGTTLSAARADATLVARRLKKQYGQDTMMSDVAVLPLQDTLVGDVRPVLLVLLAAVVLLLLVACANLANILLARVTARRRELAVRAALGASGADLTLPLIAESLLVAMAGGVVGITAAWAAVHSTTLVAAADLPHVGDIRLSWPVSTFAVVVTWTTAIGLSLLVAARERHSDLLTSLKNAERGHTSGISATRMRHGLVIGQLVVSVVLLVGAGLLGRSLMLLFRQELGFRATGVLAIDTTAPEPHINITPAGVELDDPSALRRQAERNERMLDGLASLPGVLDVGGTDDLPLTPAGADGIFIIVPTNDHTTEHLSLNGLQTLYPDKARTGEADFRVVSGGYFPAMDIPLLRGRLFDERDGADAPQVAVISDTLARTRWPNQDPIGQRIEFGGIDGDMRLLTIVGIVGDVRERGLDAAPRPIFYADFRQRPLQTFAFTFVLRTTLAPSAVIPAARRVMHDVAPGMPPRFRTVSEVVDESVAGRRFTFLVVALFAGGALVVSVLGLYGVIAFFVAERTHEFGIRMALGAQRGDVQRLVLGQALRLVAIGLAAGLILSISVGGVLRAQLFGIGTTDLPTYATVVGVLVAAALLASELPALRATRVDPARALRAD